MYRDPWPSLGDTYPDACIDCANMGRRIGWDSDGSITEELCECEKGQIVKEKGIIFDAESVRAILSGAKSMTRRVIKPQPHSDCGRILGPEWYEPAVMDRHGEMIPGKAVYGIYNEWGEWGIKCPYQPGDRLYVKEAWQTDISLDPYTPTKIAAMCLDASYESPWGPVQYADGKQTNWWEDAMPGRIRNALHMPKWAARIWLEVLAVRAEKLHAIDEDDLLAEGAYCTGAGAWEWFIPRWDALNRRRGFSFESNPYVFVYEFRRRHNAT